MTDMRIKFWWGNFLESGHLEYHGVDGG